MTVRDLERRVALLERIRQGTPRPPSSFAARLLLAVVRYLDDKGKRTLRELLIAKSTRGGPFTGDELVRLGDLVRAATRRAEAERDRA